MSKTYEKKIKELLKKREEAEYALQEAEDEAALAEHRYDEICKQISEAIGGFEVPFVHDCVESPIGWCAYDGEEDPCYDDCVFCHQPYERK